METFTDPRDDNVYKIIKIGNLYWFAENLRYQGVDHYFPDRNSDNIQKYGCLYTWDNAIKACPKGWRLSTKDEFLILINALDHLNWANSYAIQDKSWGGVSSNNTGFCTVPAGRRSYFNADYSFSHNAHFWAATPYDNKTSYCLSVNSTFTQVDNVNVNHAFSVRCVKEI